MMSNHATAFLIGLAVLFADTPAARAQEAGSQQIPSARQQDEKGALEKRAADLLEEVVTEGQGLRLTENRARVQIVGGDLFWERDEARARTLFAAASAGVAEMSREVDAANRQPGQGQFYRLRQELLLTVARHDAQLAYQFLQATRPPAPPTDSRGDRALERENNLERMLLERVAATDPKLALQRAGALLDQGLYPVTLSAVLSRLRGQDEEAAAKLSDKLLGRLQAETLLANRDAGSLALTLLTPGPRPAAQADGTQVTPQSPAQALGESDFRTLLENVIAAALRAAPSSAAGGRRAGNVRGRPSAAHARSDNSAQAQQSNARRLLGRLQALLPQVDQYFPARAQAVRLKLKESGVGNDRRADYEQLNNLMRQGTSESILTAAASAPPWMQNRLYQHAALKAVDEGNPDRALQVANSHLDATARGEVLRAAEFKRLALKAQAEKIEDVRLTLSGLPSDAERVGLLVQLAGAAQKENPKLALKLLEEARGLVARRADNYRQLEDQLRVAHAFAAVDAARSFELLGSGINRLNELFPAAAALSGFDVNIFRDGELPLQGGSPLANMVRRYGEELGFLAKADLEQALLTADKFQLAEARILARLSIVQGLLGKQPTPPPGGGVRGAASGASEPG